MTADKRQPYGAGAMYQRKSDWRWIAEVGGPGYTRTGGRKRRTVSAPGCVGGCKPRCPHIAEIKRRKKLRERELGKDDSSGASRATVKAWSEKWLAEVEKKVSPNAFITDRSAVRWIIETIGAKRLDQLTPKDIRAVSDAIVGAGKSTSTAARYHGPLMRMLKAAKLEGYTVPPNVLLVEGRKPAVSDRTAMTVDEALAILAQASQLPHGSRWLAAFLQGPRQGECLGLTWPNVSDGKLRLAWQLQPLNYNEVRNPKSGFRVPDGYEHQHLEGALHLVRPKSKAGWRVAPIVPLMQTALDHWRAIAYESPYGLVWPDEDGSPRDENADRAEFYALQAAAGVSHPTGRPYKIHEARHSTATFLMSLGVDEATRISVMGHSSIASTRTYEHRDLEHIRTALEKVANTLEIG